MASIRDKLRRITTASNPVQRGGITRVTATSIYVSSATGVKEFRMPNAIDFKVGDRVRFQGNNFLGRVPQNSNIKVVVV